MASCFSARSVPSLSRSSFSISYPPQSQQARHDLIKYTSSLLAGCARVTCLSEMPRYKVSFDPFLSQTHSLVLSFLLPPPQSCSRFTFPSTRSLQALDPSNPIQSLYKRTNSLDLFPYHSPSQLNPQECH